MPGTPTTHSLIIGLSAVFAGAVLLFDVLMPLGVAAAVPYAVLVLFSLWLPGRWTPLVYAAVGTALTLAGHMLSEMPADSVPWIVSANRVLALVAVWATAFVCDLQRGTVRNLADNEARLRALIDTATDAVIVIDERGVIQRANPACERLFGYRPEELVGRNVSMLMPSPHRERHDDYLARYLATGETRVIGVGREVEGLRRDGRRIPVRLSVGEVRIRGARLFTGLVHDLTEEKRIEQELESLQAELFRVSRITELGAMTSAIAHETNQPLTAASTYLYTLKRILRPGGEIPDNAVAVLQKALDQLDRASQVIRQIRELTRRGDVERQPEAVNEIVQDAIDIGLLGSSQLGIDLRVELGKNLPRCEVNRTQIQQVVLNLVRNGADALAESDVRRLSVETKTRDDGHVLVRVADTGPGIAGHVRERLFEPFVTTKPDGVGIGLAICRTIVESHGGRLWVEPNPEAEGGTVFAFVLRATENQSGQVRQSG